MGDRARDPLRIEVVDVACRRVETIAILRSYIAAAERGELVGLMVIAETERGGYRTSEVKMTGTDNVAERLGRLVLLQQEVLETAEEDDSDE